MSWRTVVISSRCKLDTKMGYMVVRGEEVHRVFLDFSVKIELLKCDWLTWEFKLAAKAFKIGACYYSETYSDFGFGTCPHNLYRVTVVVSDTESQRASGVQVAIGDLKGDTAENGVICFYLPEGTYTIEATDGTLTRSKKITLNAAQKVTICLSDDPDNHILDQADMDISINHSMTARREFGGNQYQLFDVSMTWPEAKAYCESLGGHLATITSAEEQAYIGSYDVCNRAAVVTFLWRAAGSPEPQSTSHPFVDVKTTDFFYKPVLWAVENEITNGIDATHFGPTADCNRAQVVTFLYRAFNEQ